MVGLGEAGLQRKRSLNIGQSHVFTSILWGSNFSELATSEFGSSNGRGVNVSRHATKCLECLRKCCYLRATPTVPPSLPVKMGVESSCQVPFLERVACRKGKRQRDEGKGQRPGPVASFKYSVNEVFPTEGYS